MTDMSSILIWLDGTVQSLRILTARPQDRRSGFELCTQNISSMSKWKEDATNNILKKSKL